jgi:hypothetical protein
MGCFSYLCKECGKGILSNSFCGEKVKLFYIKDGDVIEYMEGEYDSYGRVFIDGSQCEDVKHPLRRSVGWEHEEDIHEAHSDRHYAKTLAYDKEFLQRYEEWKDIDPVRAEQALSSIQTDPKPIKNDWGIAAVHSRCFKQIPTTISEDDPDQGWGESGELLFDVDDSFDVENYGSGERVVNNKVDTEKE